MSSRKKVSEQNPIIVETILLCVISNKNKCSVKTNRNNGQNKLLLQPEQDIYSQNNLLFWREQIYISS
jgi:hypothetical protein